MTIGFIGAGKVGTTLGKYLSTHGIQTAGYYSRSTESAQQAAQFTETKAYSNLEMLVRDCDVLFLTVPDGVITSAYQEVIQYTVEGKFICHCSGALSSRDAFPGIEDTGAFGYSVHPLFAISDKYHAYSELMDVFFALEGHEAHLQEMERMLKQTGLRVQVISSEHKTLYHCAAATASNLVVGLLGHSIHMMEQCGFDREGAISALAPLIEGNVRHVLEVGPAQALTGPLERRDAGTIEKHLNCLSSEQDRELYRLLSRKLIPIAEEKHPEWSYDTILQLLDTAGKDQTQ